MTGIHVVSRLLGIILAALSVQFVINGLIKRRCFTTSRTPVILSEANAVSAVEGLPRVILERRPRSPKSKDGRRP